MSHYRQVIQILNFLKTELVLATVHTVESFKHTAVMCTLLYSVCTGVHCDRLVCSVSVFPSQPITIMCVRVRVIHMYPGYTACVSE